MSRRFFCALCPDIGISISWEPARLSLPRLCQFSFGSSVVFRLSPSFAGRPEAEDGPVKAWTQSLRALDSKRVAALFAQLCDSCPCHRLVLCVLATNNTGRVHLARHSETQLVEPWSPVARTGPHGLPVVAITHPYVVLLIRLEPSVIPQTCKAGVSLSHANEPIPHHHPLAPTSAPITEPAGRVVSAPSLTTRRRPHVQKKKGGTAWNSPVGIGCNCLTPLYTSSINDLGIPPGPFNKYRSSTDPITLAPRSSSISK